MLDVSKVPCSEISFVSNKEGLSALLMTEQDTQHGYRLLYYRLGDDGDYHWDEDKHFLPTLQDAVNHIAEKFKEDT